MYQLNFQEYRCCCSWRNWMWRQLIFTKIATLFIRLLKLSQFPWPLSPTNIKPKSIKRGGWRLDRQEDFLKKWNLAENGYRSRVSKMIDKIYENQYWVVDLRRGIKMIFLTFALFFTSRSDRKIGYSSTVIMGVDFRLDKYAIDLFIYFEHNWY